MHAPRYPKKDATISPAELVLLKTIARTNGLTWISKNLSISPPVVETILSGGLLSSKTALSVSQKLRSKLPAAG